jgi:hypothetical protein
VGAGIRGHYGTGIGAATTLDYPAVVSAQDVELVRRWFEGFRAGEVSPELCDP